MMKNLKRIIAVVLMLALALSLAACGNGKEPNGGSNTPGGGSNTPGGGSDTPNTPEDDKYGGTITIPITEDPSTLLAWEMRTSVDDILAPIMYETLFKMDVSGVPQPYLLESYSEDAENLTYTLNVRKGVKFHDGSELNAEVVRWNIQTYLDEGILTSSFYSSVESVEAVDDYTVVLHMNAWDSLLPYAMCRSLFIVSKQAYDQGGKEALEKNPVSTAPFKFEKWDTGVGLTFTRFDDYWQGKPYLDGVNVAIYGETLVAEAAMDMGQLDIMMGVDFAVADEMSAKGYSITTSAVPSKAFTLMYASNFEGPVADVRVREAINYAIDGQAIVDALCGKYAVVSNQWTVEGSGQYNPNLEKFEYNPDKAKELLAEAGYGDGLTLILSTRSYDMEVDVCQILVDQLSKVGITVEFNPVEPTGYSATYLPSFHDLLMHPMNVYSSQWSQLSACCKQGVTTGLGAESFIHPDDTNNALNDARAAGGDEAKELFNEAVRLIFEEHVMFKPIFITYSVTVVNPKLHDCGVDEVVPYSNTLYKAWLEK